MRQKKHLEVRQLLHTEIKEKQRLENERNMTTGQRRKRRAIRVVTHALVLVLLAGSVAAIYFAVNYSMKNRSVEKDKKTNPNVTDDKNLTRTRQEQDKNLGWLG